MEYVRPVVICFGGLDPSGGAGLLADIKTIEQHRCLGFGVTTAVTCQTEDRFESSTWLTAAHIANQALPLLEQYRISAAKIGLVENFDTLKQILDLLTATGIKNIVWDPVLSASSGFNFDNYSDLSLLQKQLARITLVTPNLREAMCLTGDDCPLNAAKNLASHTQVLLKGGHHPTAQGTDHLFSGSNQITLPPTEKSSYAKHGSGCILSSSIASFLAGKASIEQACIGAKAYIERILSSTPHLLAYHYV